MTESGFVEPGPVEAHRNGQGSLPIHRFAFHLAIAIQPRPQLAIACIDADLGGHRIESQAPPDRLAQFVEPGTGEGTCGNPCQVA